VFARWGAEYPMSVQDIPCDFAPSAGLQCLSQYGTWSDIERLDLPVVLELWDEQPAPYHAALTGMDAGMLTLTIGGQELRISQRALRDAWYGGYVVLWQTPPGYRGSLRRGDANETVGWLRQQLGGVTDTPLASSSPNLFDQQLHEAVVEFQRNEGLIIDGVVGPATWIRLAGRLDLPAPHLGS
jgi:general secretion pathway protein A